MKRKRDKSGDMVLKIFLVNLIIKLIGVNSFTWWIVTLPLIVLILDIVIEIIKININVRKHFKVRDFSK